MMMHPYNSKIAGKRASRGTTLVELMVVVAILLLLAAVTIPTVKPQLEGQASREGSRVLNSAFALAKARASELGRPAGLAFQRSPDGVSCFQVLLTETPPPYAGDVYGAKVIELSGGGFGNNGFARFNGDSALLTADSPPIVNVGDRIRFNHQGAYYEIVAIDRSGPIITFRNKYAPAPPPIMAGATGVPYQIIRSPIASSRQIDMPRGVVIDLSVSGGGPQGNEFNAAAGNTSPVIVMFSPSGEIEKVFVNGSGARPQNALHMFVGVDDKVNSSNVFDADANLSRQSNVWVSVGHRNGLVTSSENPGPTDPAGMASPSIRFARRLATSSLTLAGN